MLIKGLDDLSKACVLIALKNLFDGYPYYRHVDWGEEFLVDYFIDYEKCNGFNSNNFYLIEESAPILVLPSGTYTAHYEQEDCYFRIYDRQRDVRYRLPGNRNIILCYSTISGGAHAACIPASEFLAYVLKYEYLNCMLPKHGLIIDSRRYEQDFA